MIATMDIKEKADENLKLTSNIILIIFVSLLNDPKGDSKSWKHISNVIDFNNTKLFPIY